MNSGTDRVVNVLCVPLSADSLLGFAMAGMPLFGCRRLGLAAVKLDVTDLRLADGSVAWHRVLAPTDAAATTNLAAILDQLGPETGRSS